MERRCPYNIAFCSTSQHFFGMIFSGALLRVQGPVVCKQGVNVSRWIRTPPSNVPGPPGGGVSHGPHWKLLPWCMKDRPLFEELPDYTVYSFFHIYMLFVFSWTQSITYVFPLLFFPSQNSLWGQRGWGSMTGSRPRSPSEFCVWVKIKNPSPNLSTTSLFERPSSTILVSWSMCKKGEKGCCDCLSAVSIRLPSHSHNFPLYCISA